VTVSETWDQLARRWAPSLSQSVPAPREGGSQQQDDAFRSDNEAREENVDEATDSSGAPRTGVMVAFFPTAEQARELALADGEPEDELHLTLAFLGEVGAELQPDQEQTVIDAVTAWAAAQTPIAARTNGLGLFRTPDPVTYANVDAPQLPAARQALVEALDRAGVAPLQNHGYTPHMTLDYADRRDIEVPEIAMTFDAVTVAFAGHRTTIPLGSDQKTVDLNGISPTQVKAALDQDKWPTPATTNGPVFNFYSPNAGSTAAAGNLQWSATPRPEATTSLTTPTPVATRAPGAEQGKAFATEINGRQLIAGPATAFVGQKAAGMREPTVEDIAAEHMLWMTGRFVGADKPNNNGAMWSAGDLELSRASVANGPLNWLHEAKHVIGAIADADYIGKAEAAATSMEPHITATAAIWKWLWPDEAYVVQQASDQNHLWYSMECISQEVECAGENGCGNVTSYSQYMAGAACKHVLERASTRQFKNPVFLGGAVIVPPVRPGWSEADASVINTATRLAEAAFDQAGQPDIEASTWEQMMGQLVLSAQK
jgi:2'-5' RNA ligase